jgi:acetoin utilization deacetylase AcuC-like enzyme
VTLVWSPAYRLDLGSHVWPTSKYDRVREHLLRTGVIRAEDVVEPTPAAWHDLALVHTADYLEKIRQGRFSAEEQWRLELPFSPAIAEGFRLMTGGTILTARLALEAGIAVHLGGGLHHAFADHGEGFCLFNDVAVAIRVLQRDGRLRRAAVVDLDVHQGNGTASIFANDPSVLTCSLHQEHNYPLDKPPSDLDIGLPDGATDETYLSALEAAWPHVLASDPELIVYLAGADPFVDDQLGGLALSRDGLRRRDRLVIGRATAARVPVAVVLAGGYARRLEDTVAIHAATVEEALVSAAAWSRAGSAPA